VKICRDIRRFGFVLPYKGKNRYVYGFKILRNYEMFYCIDHENNKNIFVKKIFFFVGYNTSFMWSSLFKSGAISYSTVNIL
jgi:hypothetical protein